MFQLMLFFQNSQSKLFEFKVLSLFFWYFRLLFFIFDIFRPKNEMEKQNKIIYQTNLRISKLRLDLTF